MEWLVADRANAIARGLNAASPINVVAGEGSTDLSAVIRHVEEQERRKAEAIDAALSK
jgi:hypothetical protein